MHLHTLARVAGVVGGLCWAVRWLFGLGGDGTGADLLYWAGLLLVTVALVAMGTSLVSTSAIWLRVIVGVAFPALVWSVLSVLGGGGDARTVDGVVGLVVAAVAVLGLVKGRPEKPQRPRRPQRPRPTGGMRADRGGARRTRSTGTHSR